MSIYTKTEIKSVVRRLFSDAKFYVELNGDLTMSLKGQFIDHTWKSGTFINE